LDELGLDRIEMGAQGLKPGSIFQLYAALKRRSSTVPHVPLVLRKVKIKVRGVGPFGFAQGRQECPTHTSNPGAMFEKWREAWWVMMGRKWRAKP
jgi:hypothetical protein